MTDSKRTAGKLVTVLVVEDSPTQLEQLRFLLEEAGFSVVAATNGSEGLAAARTTAIDVVISDIVMPEMDGYALCTALRTDPTLRHIPVILLTSLTDPRDVIRGLDAGANNFICKPYDDRALLARVQNVLANQQIRKDAPSEMGISIFFAGQRFFITADRLQILDLLLSTYENAVSQNAEVLRARDELRTLNAELGTRVAERTAELAERLKEVQCLNAISTLVAEPCESISESLQLAVDLIPPGWVCSEFARVRIRFGGQEFASAGFKDTAWELSTDIVVLGEAVGTVEVCYLHETPSRDGGPFLQQERELVVDIARQLGVMIGRKWVEDRDRLMRDVLQSLNREGAGLGAIRGIAQLIKQATGIEAVGIRLKDGDDFPYYETNGFPDHFVAMERCLCEHDATGAIVRDVQGNPVLECMCGNILCGRTNPKLPFFTEGASFWTNCSTELLASTTEEDRQARTRNRCNGEGYESVALIPLKTGDEVVGLLQLNDHRRDRFDLEEIRFFEGLGASIGVALARDRAETALRQEKEFTENLVDTAQTIILVLDLKGRIVRFNRHLEELAGFRLEEVRGQDWFDTFLPVRDRARIRQLFRSCMSGSPTRGNVNPIVTKDGNEREIEWYDAVVVNDGGEITGVLASGQDITERRRAEQATRDREAEVRQLNAELEARVRERTARLEAANAGLGSFAYSVSHDLRTPLRAIHGFSRALVEDCGEQLDAVGQQHLDRICAATERMGLLVDGLLELSRFARAELRRGPLDLGQIAAEIIAELKRAEPERAVQVTVAVPLTARGDRRLVGAVLDNLLANAWKFTRGRETATIEVGHEERDGETAYYVRDNGAGFDMRYADKLFVAFQRLHAADEYEGTGIGLATVQRIIVRHGGRVWAESAVDQGATFYFTLGEVPTPMIGADSYPRSKVGSGGVKIVEQPR